MCLKALGVELMRKVVQGRHAKGSPLLRDAQYKLGCAYFSGYGVSSSDELTERYASFNYGKQNS